MAQIGPIADVAHEMESLFEVISDSGLAATPEQIETLLRGHDQLAASVEAVAEQGACPPADEVLAELSSAQEAATADELMQCMASHLDPGTATYFEEQALYGRSASQGGRSLRTT